MFDHAWLTAFQNFGKSHFKNREKTPPLHFTAAAASGGCAARRCRSEANEFLMIALQDLLGARENLKLILMSATMPTRELAEYWCKVGRRRMRRSCFSSVW
jgi:hypothetical protein